MIMFGILAYLVSAYLFSLSLTVTGHPAKYEGIVTVLASLAWPLLLGLMLLNKLRK